MRRSDPYKPLQVSKYMYLTLRWVHAAQHGVLEQSIFSAITPHSRSAARVLGSKCTQGWNHSECVSSPFRPRSST